MLCLCREWFVQNEKKSGGAHRKRAFKELQYGLDKPFSRPPQQKLIFLCFGILTEHANTNDGNFYNGGAMRSLQHFISLWEMVVGAFEESA
jgi:hypothetical protein